MHNIGTLLLSRLIRCCAVHTFQCTLLIIYFHVMTIIKVEVTNIVPRNNTVSKASITIFCI